MGIFTQTEHQSCHFYKIPPPCSFQSIYRKAGTVVHEPKNKQTTIVFLLEGEISVDCDAFRNRIVKTGEMALLPVGSETTIRTLQDSCLIGCSFSEIAKVCTRVQLETLAEYKGNIPYDYNILSLRGELPHFFSLLHLYLKGKIGCPRMQEGKLEELSILFRTYYTKDELAAFFYPILSKDQQFNQFVLSNYRFVSTVEELARMANISLSAFNRKFRRYFNQSAYRWILSKRAEGVLQDIKATNKSFLEISLDWKFSSQAHLTKFAKQQYGRSPREIRGELMDL